MIVKHVGSKYKSMLNIYKLVILLFLIVLMVSCFRSNLTDHDIEIRALHIAETFDSSKVETFKKWGYTPRGEGGIWFRSIGDSVLYRCLYFDFRDSTILRILDFENFLKEYSPKLQLCNIDKLVTITKQGNGSIRISGQNSHGDDTVFITNINVDSVFVTKNPFHELRYLSNLKDSLHIFSAHYYSDLGGIFKFSLSNKHILLYIPDINKINPKYRQSWEKEFLDGKKIKRGWSLMKLKEPIDNN